MRRPIGQSAQVTRQPREHAGAVWKWGLRTKVSRPGALSCGACFCSTITSQGEAREADQHHRPGRGFGNGSRRDELAESYHLPAVVDCFGDASRRVRCACQLDNAAAAPLDSVTGAIYDADSYCLPPRVDAGGPTKPGARQAFQIDDAAADAAAPLRGAERSAKKYWTL
jgi:hypothetical protein